MANLIEQLGFPIAILIALITAIWRVWKWLQPKLDRGFDAHINLIDTLSQSSQVQSKALEDQSHSMQEQSEAIKEIRDNNRDVVLELRKLNERLVSSRDRGDQGEAAKDRGDRGHSAANAS